MFKPKSTKKLTGEVFETQMERLADCFPTSGPKEFDTKLLKAWYAELSDLLEEDFIDEVNGIIKSETFFPSIARLRGYIEPHKRVVTGNCFTEDGLAF